MDVSEQRSSDAIDLGEIYLKNSKGITSDTFSHGGEQAKLASKDNNSIIRLLTYRDRRSLEERKQRRTPYSCRPTMARIMEEYRDRFYIHISDIC